MLTRQNKEALIDDLTKNLKESTTSIICDYKGLSVSEISELRKVLREKNANMKVAKKTFTQIAFDNAKIDIDVRKIDGQVAVIYGGDDEVCSSKAAFDFSKENKAFKIKAGSLEGKAITTEEIASLAKLPSKEQLLGQVVGTIKAPITGFVGALSGNLRNLVYTLNAVKESKENA
ncbi:50S ribosomal protein L10 [bacterium]|jgi:large subunit ribosomal protein L10|nr:50S ribosomal protein L10 [bacterium]MBT4251489.1 50S ribosomal protein L10 [bacterium]MBT4597463.1 50S ribosomal protein L10 [bacterium]MBT6754302.1 50S ribosomal protein L10 [bacterium]MBT7037628.1 50S ribosomal protein L10 [bacterium]